MAWRPLTDELRAQRFAEREARAWQEREDCRGWLATGLASSELIGCMVARRHPHSAELSYVVARACWNQGYATEMVRALLERARQDASLGQIWALCDVENLASRRVLEKAGMRLEAVLPGHQRHNVSNEPRDCLKFSAQVGDPD